LRGKSETRFIAIEPESVSSNTQGKHEYDFGTRLG
jgi:predicted alternative tryptophan synthase beta-subunit